MADIYLENISKSFGNHKVLQNVSFEMKKGKLLVLLGPSGCGKTTLLKIIAGLIEADDGKIFFDKKEISTFPTQKREAVIVFQDYSLFPHMTVAENIGFGLRMKKKSQMQIKNKVKELLTLIQMESMADKYPAEISGGQKQRVAFARALAVEPKVILLDEPFSNLDAPLREEMREIFMRIHRHLSISTIMVTHDQEEGFLMADKVIVLLEGKIQQIGQAYEIYNEPANFSVAKWLGEKNLIRGEVKNGYFHCEWFRFPVRNKDCSNALLWFRPEHMQPISNENIEKQDEFVIEAEIDDVEFRGAYSICHLKKGNQRIRMKIHDHLPLKKGQIIRCQLSPEKIRVYEDDFIVEGI